MPCAFNALNRQGVEYWSGIFIRRAMLTAEGIPVLFSSTDSEDMACATTSLLGILIVLFSTIIPPNVVYSVTAVEQLHSEILITNKERLVEEEEKNAHKTKYIYVYTHARKYARLKYVDRFSPHVQRILFSIIER